MIASHSGSRRKRLFVASGLVVLMLASVGGSAGTAHAASCASKRDMAALNSRVLQTELMVAALTCDQHADYNFFAKHFRQALMKHGTNLRAMFSRTYGGAANRRLDAFVTRLANDASQRTMQLRQGYCAFAVKLFEEANTTPSGQFDQLLLKPWLRTRHGFPPCVG